MSSRRKIHMFDGGAYIEFANAAIVITDSKSIFANPDADPIKISIDNDKTEYRGVVPWGASNDMPQQIITKVEKSPDMSTNMLFNIAAGYGDGVMPVRIKYDDTGKKIVTPATDSKDVNEFFINNDTNNYLMEQITDLNYFFNVYPEIILTQDPNPTSRKVIELTSKEAAFSRWEAMDPTDGLIKHHFYSSKWVDGPKGNEITATKVLNPKNPILDLKRKMGIEPYADAKGTKKDDQVFRYIIPLNFPTPGRFYYQKPYWYSLIESGWYDYALLIPEFKKAMLNNQMMLKYMVYIHKDYFKEIFAAEGKNTPEEQKARVKEEYDNIGKYLSGAKNAGKASFGYFQYSPDGGNMQKKIVIEPIKNEMTSGTLVEDSEEVSNIIAYGMGVHASLIGSHGKSKTISGSEARELFIIKQAMLKPFRDILLKPFYLIKAINKWPEDIHFVIPNMELTTIDQGTGAKKVISQPAV